MFRLFRSFASATPAFSPGIGAPGFTVPEMPDVAHAGARVEMLAYAAAIPGEPPRW